MSGLVEAQDAQQIKAWIVQLGCRDTQSAGAEVFAQRPLVEHKADVEGRGQSGFDLSRFLPEPKPWPIKRGVVDPRRIADGAVTNGISNDFLDLLDG